MFGQIFWFIGSLLNCIINCIYLLKRLFLKSHIYHKSQSQEFLVKMVSFNLGRAGIFLFKMAATSSKGVEG